MNDAKGGDWPGSGGRPGPWVIVLLFAGAVIAAFAVYAGSLRNEFVWDDPIVLNQQLQAFHSIKDIFFPPARIPQFGRVYYRPLITLSYLIDRSLWGDTPFGFHFPVVIFHALNSGFVFLLGRRLFGGTVKGLAASMGGALLFATHPIHTESVCWMAGRSDTLATLFLLPALLAYLAWKSNRSRMLLLALASVLFLAGCLAKESAFGIFLAIVLGDWFGVGEPGQSRAGAGEGDAARRGADERPSGARERKSRSRQTAKAGSGARTPKPAGARSSPGLPWLGWASLSAASVVYYMMRTSALAAEASPLRMQNPDFGASILTLLRAVGFYVSKILVPINLDAYIPEIPSPGLFLAIGAAALPAAAALVWIMWGRGRMLASFLFSWFFSALAPSLAIAYFTISEAPVAERYLYLPSVGFCLLLGYLAFVWLPELIPQPAQRMVLYAAVAFFLALSGVYAAGTVVRGRVWRADLEFWKDGVAKSPTEGLPRLHLGLAYANQGQDDLAEAEYLKAIDPSVTAYDVEGRSTALNNLGMLYMGKRNYQKAQEYFERAITMRPDYATPYYGVGVTALRQGEEDFRQGRSDEGSTNLRKAESYLTKAIDLNPQYTKAHNQIGYLLLTMGRKAEGLEHLNRVLQLVSRGPEHDFASNLKRQAEQGGRR